MHGACKQRQIQAKKNEKKHLLGSALPNKRYTYLTNDKDTDRNAIRPCACEQTVSMTQ